MSNSLIFLGKVRLESSKGLLLTENVRLEWQLMAVANTLAYYGVPAITAVKSFLYRALESQVRNFKVLLTDQSKEDILK